MDAKPDSNEFLSAIRAAIACPDRDWYRAMLKGDICGCPISDEEASELLDGAMRTGSEMAQKVREKVGDCLPEEAAADLQLKIVERFEELREPFLFLGLYEPENRTITLNRSAVSLVEGFIASNNLKSLLSCTDITRSVLFHEIFHALEEETLDIFTRSHTLKRKALGIFHYQRRLDSISEVGAVHFSKCMTGLHYSPCIYERLLLLALGKLAMDRIRPVSEKQID